MQIDERLTFLNEMQLPAVITAIHGEPLVELLAARREPLAAILRHYGAILFRGFGLRTAEEFQAAAAECFGDVLRPYVCLLYTSERAQQSFLRRARNVHWQ